MANLQLEFRTFFSILLDYIPCGISFKFEVSKLFGAWVWSQPPGN